MISELKRFIDTDALTVWAQRILGLKNQLTTSDAQEVEAAFAAKLDELGNDVKAPFEAIARVEVGGDSEPATVDGSANLDREPIRTSEKPKHAPKLNGNRVPKRGAARRNASIVGAISQTPAKSVTPLSKELRLRDRDHLKFVGTQPCLACGRSPSDAHHLKFAQQRALARKVSDEFAVPLCRLHHRALHRNGDERTWWQQLNLDPLPIAQRLWQATRLETSLFLQAEREP